MLSFKILERIPEERGNVAFTSSELHMHLTHTEVNGPTYLAQFIAQSNFILQATFIHFLYIRLD